jgi:hypothetical protein
MHIALMTSAMVLWAVAALAQAESRPAAAKQITLAPPEEPADRFRSQARACPRWPSSPA